MVLIRDSVHPRSLDFANQKKVIILRDTKKKGNKKMPWKDIAKRVVNLQGEEPSEWVLSKVYREFNRKLGRCVYHYKNSGRKKWKVTQAVEKFLIKRLLQLRKECVCTSTLLARDLARAKAVEVECSIIRKVLKRNGYQWRPRAQKPKYSDDAMRRRLDFAKCKRKLGLAIDGVVLTIPPSKTIERENYCHYGDTHMWRKRGEAAMPELAGADHYAKQVPISRAIPMWGAISEAGFSVIMFHSQKKVVADDWEMFVEKGKLAAVARQLNPSSSHGPWHMLCDGEKFLHTAQSRRAYRKWRIKVWKTPAKSPDLNPIEKFWAWLRRQLRAHDFKDLKAGRPVPGKTAYRQRVRNILRSAKAQTHAAACARGLRKVCAEVVKKHGAASRG